MRKYPKAEKKAVPRVRVTTAMMDAGEQFVLDRHAYAHASKKAARMMCAGIFVAMMRAA